LRDVVLRDQQGAEVARLDEVRLSYDLTALLTQRLVVRRVDLVRPRATLVQGPEGQWNIVRVLAPLSPASRPSTPARPMGDRLPAALVVQRLHIHDGQMAVQTPALPGVPSLTLTAAGPPDALTVRGQLSTAAGQLDLHGQLNTVVTPWRYSSSLALRHVNLATLLRQEPLQSDLNLHLHLQGAGFSPEVLRGAVHLDIQPSTVGGITLHPSGCHIAVQPGRVQVQDCDLHTSVARLTATGLLDLAGSSALQYDLTADLAGLRALLRTEALDGILHVRGQASGELTAISAQGSLEGQRLRYGAHRLETLQLLYAGIHLGAQPHVTAQLGIDKARVGSVPVERVHAEATYDSSVSQLRVATEVVQSSVYSARARGTLTWTERGQQLVVDDLLVRLADHPWRTLAPVEVLRGAGGLRLTQLHLAHADEAIELSGAVDGEQLQDLRLQISQLDLAYFQRLVPLPEPLGGRASLQVHLTGTFTEPQVQGELTLQPGSAPGLPFEQLQSTLVYAQKHLQSTTRLRQVGRDVLALEVRLPIDAAFTPLTLAERLRDAPVTVRLQLAQPDLVALHRWQPALPRLSGSIQGTMGLQGSYAALKFETSLQLQQLGIEGLAERLSAPIRLTGGLVMAPSVPELIHAMQQGRLTPQVRDVVLRVPTLQGQVPSPDAPAQPIAVQDLLLQAQAQWNAAGLQATLQTLRLQAKAFDFPQTTLDLAARWTPEAVELSRLQLRTPQSTVQGQGRLAMPGQELQLRFDIPQLRLDEFRIALPPTLPPAVQGVIHVNGSLQAPRLEARLQHAGAQILADLGLTQVRLMTNNPRKLVGLDGFGLSILDRVPLEVPPTPVNAKYLKAKREKLGHLLLEVLDTE